MPFARSLELSGDTVHSCMASMLRRGRLEPRSTLEHYVCPKNTCSSSQGHDYSSGVWQFEGYGYVPSGTSGVSVMQIHNEKGAEHATILMLHVYGGVLRFYDGPAITGDIYDRWFRLNVVHDAEVSMVAMFVNVERKFSADVIVSRSYYFEFGVYMQHCD
uniref:Alginate lyase 2 domain-containing protein n=2 Tax=Oryza brachyantha TaxID=4533 RepID=J3NBP3_ORYBR